MTPGSLHRRCVSKGIDSVDNLSNASMGESQVVRRQNSRGSPKQLAKVHLRYISSEHTHLPP